MMDPHAPEATLIRSIGDTRYEHASAIMTSWSLRVLAVNGYTATLANGFASPPALQLITHAARMSRTRAR